MLEGGEAGLVLGGSQVDALLEHAAVPAAELLRVGGGGLLEAGDGALAEEEPEHSGDGATAHGMTGLTASLEDALNEGLGDLLEVLVGTLLTQDLQGLDSCTMGNIRFPELHTALTTRTKEFHLDYSYEYSQGCKM